MIKLSTKKIQPKEFFCETYWNKIRKSDIHIPNLDVFNFHLANRELMGVDRYYKDTDKELKQLIKNSDITFAFHSVPIESNIILYRGIAKPNDTNTYLKKRYEKCTKLKKGDIFSMPEYPFFSKLKAVALTHASDKTGNKGIIYEITVPKGTNLLKKIHYVLKRYSKFLCTENKKREAPNGETYHHIKLMLLPREFNSR